MLQGFLLFFNVLSIPILIPQPQVTGHNSSTVTFQPLSLVIQDPLYPQRYRSLSLDSARNHEETLEQQNRILEFGESLSLDLSKALLSPFLALNNGISSAASQLPSFLATNGALIGSAIATPIHLGTLAANNIAAGVTGTLVSIPISIGSGVTAQVIGLAQTGQELVTYKKAEIQKFIEDHAYQLAQPLAAIKGAHAIVQGATMKTIGTAAHHVSGTLQSFGSKLSDAAQVVHHFANQASNYALANHSDYQTEENIDLTQL